MRKISKTIKRFFKIIWTTFKVIYFIIVLILLGVIGYIVYLLHPLYIELKPTIPDTYYSSDKLTWTFFRYKKNPNVYQKLTIFQDGRNEIEITREMGDFDIDMLGPIMHWNPRRDKDLEVMIFKRKNVISKEKAGRIFKEAIKSGVLNITDADHVNGKTLIIDIGIGLEDKSVVGPDFVGSPIAYPPEKWINKIYWQKLTNIINDDYQLKPLMNKVRYIKKPKADIIY